MRRRPNRADQRRAETDSGSRSADGPVGFNHPDVIDTIALSPQADLIQLVIHQDMQWVGSSRTRQLLDKKLNTYIRFIQSGQLRINYPQAARARWQIVWAFDGKLDRLTEEYLDGFTKKAQRAGGDFKLHPSEEEWSWSFRGK